MNLEKGTIINQYKILSAIGAGGMGEVYLAEDTRLRRRVALKVLPENLASDKERLRRFEQEAFAASALNHPNILTIHEFAAAGGVHFLASEYVEGETLREKLNRAGLSLDETLDIAQQTAFALTAAHAAGIVHRDVKPENIMLRRDRIVKVLDFGLAKLVGFGNADLGFGIEENETLMQSPHKNPKSEIRNPKLTNPGVVMGTVSYMSPEQAKGKETDTGTDIWSFGVVVYEMLTRRLPFEGETPNEYIASILKSDPLPLENKNREIPVEVAHIVRKALRKDKDARYQTMKSLLADLKELSEEIALTEKLERSASPKRIHQTENQATRTVNAETTNDAARVQTASSAEYIFGEIKRHKSFSIAALVILLLAVGGLGYWFYANGTPSAKQIESIAVLPFVNQSGNADTEYLSDGMTETLINNLSQLPNLSVKARSSVFHYKGKQIKPQTVGNELSVQAILNGRVIQRGDNLTLSLELVDARTGNQIWGEQYNRKQSDLVALQTEIARDVSQKLRTKLSGADEKKLAKNYTANPEAYQLYLKGRHHFLKITRPETEKAISYFQQAIAVDPNYALAYAGLADAYRAMAIAGEMSPAEFFPKAKAAAQKAIEIDNTLADAYAVLGFITFWFDWNWNEAENQFKRALELDPDNADAHIYYANLLSNMKRHDEALAEAKRARELDPLNLRINALEAQFLLHAGRTDEALARLQKTLELDPDYWLARIYTVSAYIEKRMYEEAVTAARGARDVYDSTRTIAFLGFALAKSGKQREARVELERLTKLSAERWVSPYNVAMISNGLDEREETLRWLERGIEQRDPRVTFLKVEPKWNNLRSDARYQDLLRRIGLPQ